MKVLPPPAPRVGRLTHQLVPPGTQSERATRRACETKRTGTERDLWPRWNEPIAGRCRQTASATAGRCRGRRLRATRWREATPHRPALNKQSPSDAQPIDLYNHRTGHPYSLTLFQTCRPPPVSFVDILSIVNKQWRRFIISSSYVTRLVRCSQYGDTAGWAAERRGGRGDRRPCYAKIKVRKSYSRT